MALVLFFVRVLAIMIGSYTGATLAGAPQRVNGTSYQDYKIENSGDLAEFILREGLVGVVGGGAFGADECIRISYAASEAELREALKRIKEALAKLS